MLIRVSGVKKIYEVGIQKIEAVAGIDLEIDRNEYVAIMGPSGSGKSTFMNLLGCLDTPSAGDYWLNGKEVSNLSDDELARIRNRLRLPDFQPASQGDCGAERRVASDIRRHPGRRAPQKSCGGDRIGRAHRQGEAQAERAVRGTAPEGGNRQGDGQQAVDLADEPTGNLDSKTGIEIMSLFDTIHQAGNTIVMVTHEEHIANYAMREIKLLDGKIESDVRTG